MKHIALAIAALSMLAGATAADAKACRDAHGKFIKCAKVVKKVARCRNAHGHFAKCK